MARSNRINLNDKIIRAARPTPPRTTVDLWDSNVPGLVLRASHTGRRVFYVAYRKAGARQYTWTIVRDPALLKHEYPILTLERARDLAQGLLKGAAAGTDPAIAQQIAQQTAATDAARTWRALGDLYLAEWAIPRKSKAQAQEDARNLRTQTAALDAVPVRQLTRGQIRAVLDGITNRGARVRAIRVKALISKMLNLAVDREWVASNVAARMDAGKNPKRRRVLSADDVRALWTWAEQPPPDALDADAARAWRLNRAVLQLRLITTARGNEILGMRWKDLDWSPRDHGPWWTIPVTKNGHPHRLPLSKPAIAVIRKLERYAESVDPDAYVFAGIRGKRQRRGVLGTIPVRDFLPRDLRRTATSNMSSLGVDRFIVRRILNHVDAEVTADYDLYAYGPEKRAALDQWASRLQSLIKPIRLVARP